MRPRFESPDIWPGFVDLFAGFALLVVASVLSAQIVVEKKTQDSLDLDHRIDADIGNYVVEHRGQHPIWNSIEVDTSGIGRAIVSLPGRITFESKHSELKPEAREALGVISGLLAHLKSEGAARVYVIGFADTVRVRGVLPDGSRNNLELSARRATNAAEFLARGHALGDTFIVVSAMGDKQPYIADRAIDLARSRRIELDIHYQEPNWTGR